MRTETTTRELYKFDELDESAQSNAISNLYDINVDDSFWYECIQDETKELGFEIKSFDINRSSIAIKLDESPETICERILKNHGESCDTWKLASDYIKGTDLSNWFDTDLKNETGMADRFDPEHKDFIHALSEEYLSMLRREYEHLTSEEAIRETIEANEYEFTEEGKLA